MTPTTPPPLDPPLSLAGFMHIFKHLRRTRLRGPSRNFTQIFVLEVFYFAVNYYKTYNFTPNSTFTLNSISSSQEYFALQHSGASKIKFKSQTAVESLDSKNDLNTQSVAVMDLPHTSIPTYFILIIRSSLIINLSDLLISV